MKIPIICFLLMFSACYSQKWEYREIPESWLVQVTSDKNLSEIDLSEFVDVTSFLPKGYVEDGTIDYTNYLQEAIVKNRKILMPNFSILINDNALVIPSNSIIYFQTHSQLIMSPSSISDNRYYTLLLNKVSNVTIYNCNIKGDRLNHIGSLGEWGMGIGIIGSSDIKIIGGYIEDCWGDGIYIGKFKQNSSKYKGYHIPSENIVIKNVIVDNCRRNGISITSGVNIDIENSIFSNTNGTLPMAGIDIEPNSSFDLIKEIKIHNVLTANNMKDGVLLALTKNTSSTLEQNISISINDHTDIGSYSPLRIGSGFRKEDKKIKGLISITNTLWKENQVGVRYNKGVNLLPNINFKANKFIENRMNTKERSDKYNNTINLNDI